MPKTITRPSLSDFQRHLAAQAAHIAASDVTALVAKASVLRTRLRKDAAGHPQFAQQAEMALQILSDHAAGDCPQIPYHTISILCAALYYYQDPYDVVPDRIPRAGLADDALILELAWKVAHAGIQRYLDWKGLTMPHVAAIGKARALPTKKRAGTRKPQARRT